MATLVLGFNNGLRGSELQLHLCCSGRHPGRRISFPHPGMSGFCVFNLSLKIQAHSKVL